MAERIEPSPAVAAAVADEGRQPHVLAAAQRDHRAQHREPEEQHGGEFVRPGERFREDVARPRAGAEDQDLGHDQAAAAISVRRARAVSTLEHARSRMGRELLGRSGSALPNPEMSGCMVRIPI